MPAPPTSLEDIVPLLSVAALYRLALCSEAGYAAASRAEGVWESVCLQHGLVRSRYDARWLDTLARNIRQRVYSHVAPPLWVPGQRTQLEGVHALFTIQHRTCGPLRNTIIWKSGSVYGVVTAEGVHAFAHGFSNGVVDQHCAVLVGLNAAGGPDAGGGALPPLACKNGGTCRRAPLGMVAHL